jgi:hypothetical protein
MPLVGSVFWSASTSFVVPPGAWVAALGIATNERRQGCLGYREGPDM